MVAQGILRIVLGGLVVVLALGGCEEVTPPPEAAGPAPERTAPEPPFEPAPEPRTSRAGNADAASARAAQRAGNATA